MAGARVFGAIASYRWSGQFFSLLLLTLLFSCASSRVQRAGTETVLLKVLVENGVQAALAEGGEVMLVEDESRLGPSGYVFVFGRRDFWRLEQMRARLLAMGALRVEVE